MSGDILHPLWIASSDDRGHINFLKKARALSTKCHLVVGIQSDADLKALKREPVMNFKERFELLSSCKYIDEIVVCEREITRDFIDRHKIDLVVHGDDIKNDPDSLRAYRAPQEMGILKFVKYTKGISTTDIIERITDHVAFL